MSDREELVRDLLLAQYLTALEGDDLDTLAAIWQQAETDRELEQALIELSEGYVAEQGLDAAWDEEASRVQALAAEHFAARPLADETGNRPLTAADVAAQLQANAASGAERLTDADRQANERLLSAATPLPERLGQTALEAWCREAGIQASRQYWRLFRRAAIRLSLARSQQQTRLAARTQTPKREEP